MGERLFWNTRSRYGVLSIVLHWVLAIGFLGMILMGFLMADDVFSAKWVSWYPLHKKVGIVLLCMVLLRWFSRYYPVRVCSSSHALHNWLYAGLTTMPVSGWVMSCASGKAPVLFGVSLWVVPSGSQGLAKIASWGHLVFALLMVVLIVGHVWRLLASWSRGERLVYKMMLLRKKKDK